MEKWLTISTIAEQLGLAENTARRYANIFKDYITSRQFGRATKYGPEALEVLANVSRMYQEGLSTQEIQESLRGAYTLYVDVPEDNQLPANVNMINEIRETMAQMAEYMKRQDELNQALTRELSDQRDYIEQSVKERDEKLMAALQTLTEARKEVAAAKWWKWWK